MEMLECGNLNESREMNAIGVLHVYDDLGQQII